MTNLRCNAVCARKIRALWIICGGIALAATGAMAAEQTLSGAQIGALLTGNSAVYENGAKQFFGADGRTFYQASGRPVEHGTWRVAENQYCSRWGIPGVPSRESCYAIEQNGEHITWNRQYPATIRPGDIFNPDNSGGNSSSAPQ